MYSLQPKGFTNNTLNPVPLNSPFELSVNTDPQTIATTFIGTIDKRKTLAVTPHPLPVNLFKLPALTQQGCLREFKPGQYCLSGEALTPSGTTGIKNCTTGTGRHPTAESVGTFSFNITWLESSFTHDLLLVRIACGKFIH